MAIVIGKPCALSEKGGRLNNEDSIYPLPEFVSPGQRLFLVCDGVGGAEKGEVASSLACEYFQTYFTSMLDNDKDPDPDFIQKALRYTEANFDTYIAEHPEATGMATTFTMLYIANNSVISAHIGDSRIYQFRDGKIKYKTEDHSLVNSLVKLGQINPEDAINHPQKNIITRAIHGTRQPAEADIAYINDIQPGDCFFMCTDGVLEVFSDDMLSSVFERKAASEVIKDILMESCNGKTRDNFSFYIIPIQNIQEITGIRQNILSFFYSFI